MAIKYNNMTPGQLYEFSLDISPINIETKKYVGIYITPYKDSTDNIMVLCGSEIKHLRNFCWSARKL